MFLRTAKISDIAACAALDASYTTTASWQISEERPARGQSSPLIVELRRVELPRPRSVVPPDPTEDLAAEWETRDLFLVAEDERVIGYLCATLEKHCGWITRLVVDKPHRRSGVATALLAATGDWARENDLKWLLAAAPTKNYPVIALLRARGYHICGYNERHFANGDIALYLAHDIADG